MTMNVYQKSYGSVRSQLSLCTLPNCSRDSHKKCNNSGKRIQSKKKMIKKFSYKIHQVLLTYLIYFCSFFVVAFEYSTIFLIVIDLLFY